MAEQQKLKTNFIFEILGRPKEHIVSSLGQLIDKLGEIKGVKVLNKKIHEPNPVEDENVKDMFATFGEAELELDGLEQVFLVTLNMLPSNIEILEPAELRLRNFDLSNLLTELAIKIHRYDEIAKALTHENHILQRKLGEIHERIMQAQQRASQSTPYKISATMSGAGKVEEKNKPKNKTSNNKDKKKKAGKNK